MNLSILGMRTDRKWSFLPLAGLVFTLPAVALPTRAAENTNPSPSIQAIIPPTPLPTQSPIQFFRRLLAMSPEELEQALAVKAPPQRPVLLAKIKEYKEMPEKKRELRLHLLQLRLYMLPLMNTPASDRAMRLAAIPEKDRPVVQARLQDWDRLSADEQALILRNDTNLHYFLFRGYSSPTMEQEAIAIIIPPERGRRLEEAIAHWHALPEAQREDISLKLGHFLIRDPAEWQRLLNTLPDHDRLPMQHILERLTTFSREQRLRWVDGFSKFASLSPQERCRFILQAERWQKMSNQERDLWRLIVARTRSPSPSLKPGDLPWPPPLSSNPSRGSP
jgi:hypothetical protein